MKKYCYLFICFFLFGILSCGSDEVLEEKLSLAERFGLWLSFYPFTQAEYLQVLDRAFEVYPVPEAVRTSEELRLEALQWAIERGGRSGRVAMQFAKLVSAREALKG